MLSGALTSASACNVLQYMQYHMPRHSDKLSLHVISGLHPGGSCRSTIQYSCKASAMYWFELIVTCIIIDTVPIIIVAGVVSRKSLMVSLRMSHRGESLNESQKRQTTC